MGRNDYHVTADGRLAPGLATTSELHGVVTELADLEAAEALHATLQAQIQTLKDKDLPMLKGKGFIVIDPKNPRFTGEEYETVELAAEEGTNVAYQSGIAIVYAPVRIMKPRRETVSSEPSELLKQLGLPDAAPVAVTDGTAK
jgi:hypothetical protein